jgi:hypothetical protein
VTTLLHRPFQLSNSRKNAPCYLVSPSKVLTKKGACQVSGMRRDLLRAQGRIHFEISTLFPTYILPICVDFVMKKKKIP